MDKYMPYVTSKIGHYTKDMCLSNTADVRQNSCYRQDTEARAV